MNKTNQSTPANANSQTTVPATSQPIPQSRSANRNDTPQKNSKTKKLHSTPNNVVQEIGMELQQDGSGGCVELNTGLYGNLKLLYFTRIPQKQNLVLLHEGCVLAVDRKQICSLVSLHDKSYNKSNGEWRQKSHGDGRITVMCSAIGTSRPPQIQGLRARQPKREQCSARINLRQMDFGHGCSPDQVETSPKAVLIRDAINKMVSQRVQTSTEPSGALPSRNHLFHISRMEMRHTCTSALHTLQVTERHQVTSKSQNSVTDDTIRAYIESFMEMADRNTRQDISAITKYLSQTFPGINITAETVTKVVHTITKNEKEGNDLVKYLQEQYDSKTGSVEYLYYIQSDTGLLHYCTWTPGGSKEVVYRYGRELGNIESTCECSGRRFKLITWLVQDCSLRWRPVLFALIEDESLKTYQRIFANYMRAFDCDLPPAILADENDALIGAIESAPGKSTHLLPFRQLIDHGSIKTKVAPYIFGGPGNWDQFRQEIVQVQESITVDEFERKWMALLHKWLQNTGQSENKNIAAAREYMEKKIYSAREKWACSFFPNLTTLCSVPAPPIQSWHSGISELGVQNTPLSKLTSQLLTRVKQIDEEEKKDGRKPDRHSHSLTGSLLPSLVSQYLVSANVSAFVANAVTEEYSFAAHMTASFPEYEYNQQKSSYSISSVISYGFTNGESGNIIRTKVEFQAKKDNKQIRAYNWNFSCACNSLRRLMLPCRHIISFLLNMIREGKQEDQKQVQVSSESQNCWNPILESLLMCTSSQRGEDLQMSVIGSLIGRRWLHSITPTLHNNHFVSQPFGGNILDEFAKKWIHKVLQDRSTPNQENTAMPYTPPTMADIGQLFRDQHAAFPLSPEGGGMESAQNKFLSVAEATINSLSKNEAGLTVAHCLLNILSKTAQAHMGFSQRYGAGWALDDTNRKFMFDYVHRAVMEDSKPSGRPLPGQSNGTDMIAVFRGDARTKPDDNNAFLKRDDNDSLSRHNWEKSSLPLPWEQSTNHMTRTKPQSQPKNMQVKSLVNATHDDNSVSAGWDEALPSPMTDAPLTSNKFQTTTEDTSIRPSIRQHNLQTVSVPQPHPSDLEPSDAQPDSTPSKRPGRFLYSGRMKRHKHSAQKQDEKEQDDNNPNTKERSDNKSLEAVTNTSAKVISWACPRCVCIESQSNKSQVVQHWYTHHQEQSKKQPTNDEFRIAANSYEERMKKAPKRGSRIKVRFWIPATKHHGWYKGTVTKQTPNGTTIEYDDGDVVVHDFHNDRSEAWKVIDDDPEYEH